MTDIPIYVISVKTFTDRHQHIEEMANRFGFRFEYIFDFDADDLGSFGGRHICPSLRPASISNVLKHLEAVRRTAFGDSEFALILEDDVVLFDDFFRRLDDVRAMLPTLKPGWLIFVGGADNKIDQAIAQSMDFELVKHPITTAEAYLIDRAGCQLREQWLLGNTIDCQADHQLKKMDQALGIQHYWVTRPMATQGSITGKFKTALDHSRSKRSAAFLQIKYQWNCFRRQALPRWVAKLMRVVKGRN